MSLPSPTPEEPAAPSAKFFRIAVGLLATLLLCILAAALFLVGEAKGINNSGGWGWLLVMAIFVVATTVVCLGCAICTAVSLYRREAHRRASIVILVCSTLVVLGFGPPIVLAAIDIYRRGSEPAHAPKVVPPPPVDAIVRSPIPDALAQHFRSQGILLRPRDGYASRDTEWIVESVNVGPRCEIVVTFVQFWSGASVDDIQKKLMAVSIPSVINENAKMAMFIPYARGRTSDRNACEEWPAKSGKTVEQLTQAFKSYQSVPASNSLKPD